MEIFQVLSHVVEGPVAQNTSLCFRLSYPSPQPFSFSSSLSRLSRLYNISILISDINFSYLCWSNISFGCGIHEQRQIQQIVGRIKKRFAHNEIFLGVHYQTGSSYDPICFAIRFSNQVIHFVIGPAFFSKLHFSIKFQFVQRLIGCTKFI